MSTNKKASTVRTRKFLLNKLLERKQMIIDVIHPGRANCSRAELKTKIAKMYNVSDENTIFIFGIQTAFGGGKSSGYCLIYDNVTVAKKHEPRYRLVRQGLAEAKSGSKKQRNEKKNRLLKLRGTAKYKEA